MTLRNEPNPLGYPSAPLRTQCLHEITAVAGAPDLTAYTLGAAVSGSTVAFASQAANTRGQATLVTSRYRQTVTMSWQL